MANASTLDNTDNFNRYSKLVFYPLTDALRYEIDVIVVKTAKSFHDHVIEKKQDIFDGPNLTRKQKALLFRNSNPLTTKIMDVSLLVRLHRVIFAVIEYGIHPKDKAWNKPSGTDRISDVVRIREIRNHIAHASTQKMSTAEFMVKWIEAVDVIERLTNKNKSFMDRVQSIQTEHFSAAAAAAITQEIQELKDDLKNSAERIEVAADNIQNSGMVLDTKLHVMQRQISDLSEKNNVMLDVILDMQEGKGSPPSTCGTASGANPNGYTALSRTVQEPATIDLYTQPWYIGNIAREKCEKVMKKKAGEKEFVIRDSTTLVGNLVMSVLYKNKMHHFPIQQSAGGYRFQGYDFQCIGELIRSCQSEQSCTLFNDGKKPIALGQPFTGFPR